MRIGLDFDGVLSDCGTLKSETAKTLYGVDIPPERFKKEIVVGGGHMTMEQYLKLQGVIYGTREYGMRMRPVEGVLTHVPALLAEGHDVRIITSRTEEMLAIAKEWAQTHLGFTLPFTGVGHGLSKADAAQGIDLYVDDDLDKLAPLVGVVPRLFLFSWGYNSHVDPTGVASRVASWDELAGAIRSAANAKQTA